MPAKNTPIFSNKDTRTWVQPDGVGTPFVLYGCHALTEWTRDFQETVYIKCKSADEYGKKDIKETIPGDANAPTFTVEAFTSQDDDFMLGVECPVDWQEFYGACSTPSDVSGYTKIRHFYRASKTSEGESNIDFIGDEAYSGIRLSVGWSCEEIIEILQVVVTDSANGVTEAQAFNDIAMLAEARCEGDCGIEIGACQWGVAVSDATYGAATANVWVTSNGGATWTLCATDPFADNEANVSSCVILPGETTPRIIVFRGNLCATYNTRCSISDDWGTTWTEVAMGVDGQYINGVFKYSAGLIYAVGDRGWIYYSEDRGESWTEIDGTAAGATGVNVDLWDIHTPDGDTIYAVGSNDTVIRSVDGGTTWTTLTGPADGTENLYTVQAPTRYRVLIGGQIDAGGEVLWVSEDGGTSWTALTFTGSTTASGEVRRLRLTKKAPLQHMVLIHGVNNGATMRYGPGTNFRFYRTLNGGESWERQNLVTNSGLNGLSVCDINTAFACGEPQGGVAVIQRMAAA